MEARNGAVRLVAIVSCAAALLVGGGARAADAPPRNVEDDLVAATLDADGESFDGLRALLATRPVPAMRDALERAAAGPDPNCAALAAALAAAAARPSPPPPGGAGPSGRPPESAHADVRDVIVLLKDRDDPPPLGSHAPDPFDVHGSYERRADPVVASVERRSRALVRLASASTSPAIPPLVPWLAHFADDASAPRETRLALAAALAARAPNDQGERVLRVVRDCGGGSAREVLDIVESLGTPEAAAMLLRVEAGVETVRDGGDVAVAKSALARLRKRAPDAVAKARSAALEVLRTYEAESEPIRHSTGVAVDGGWQARAGRDAPQHMLFGPYADDLPHAWIVARFRYRVDGEPSGSREQDVVRFEATSQEMERQGWAISSVTVRGSDVRPGEWATAEVGRWTDPRPGRMEFRVWWAGTADVTVDRVELLRVRRPEPPPAPPPRAPSPWMSRADAAGILPETAAVLFDAAASSRGFRYEAAAAALVAAPEAARPVLLRAAEDASRADRAWLARVLLARIDDGAEFLRLRAAHDAAFVRLESCWSEPGWTLHPPPPHEPFFRRPLETGAWIVPIRGGPVVAEPPSPIPDELRPRPREPGPVPTFGELTALPEGRRWPEVFAEVWLTAERPAPLDPAMDRSRLPPGDGPPPGQAGHDRLKSRRLVPFSTTGHRRLHALQWLAAYGVPDARRAATTLAAETTATFAERAAASRIKARR